MRESIPLPTHGATPYTERLVQDPAAVDARLWNALVEADGAGNVFLRHEFLHALHASGCASADTGWAARWLTLWTATVDGARLDGAVPLYDKSHSYGEYVFDWAWAEAYARHGIRYYPKRLVAVPSRNHKVRKRGAQPVPATAHPLAVSAYRNS